MMLEPSVKIETVRLMFDQAPNEVWLSVLVVTKVNARPVKMENIRAANITKPLKRILTLSDNCGFQL